MEVVDSVARRPGPEGGAGVATTMVLKYAGQFRGIGVEVAAVQARIIPVRSLAAIFHCRHRHLATIDLLGATKDLDFPPTFAVCFGLFKALERLV